MFLKQTKILSFFNNLFASPKPRKKRRVVFFVLVFFVFSSLFLSTYSSCVAKINLTPDETNYVKKLYPNITDAQIQAEADKWNDYSAFITEIQNKYGGPSGITVADSLNSFSGKAAFQGLLDAGFYLVIKAVIAILSIIASFLKVLVYYAAQTLDFTLNPTLYNFSNSPIVVKGWVMVRDVCNLFFLLVLLFIAICTILKIEKYHAKKTLLMLIIMALLINFSKPITVFIFDGSQLLMNFFLNQMGSTGTGKETSTIVAEASKIAKIVYETLPDNNGEVPVAIQYLFAVVFLFMLAVAFVVTALMLIIRIVAVMMLIIVSPLAFFAAIVPDFSKMSSQWWSALFEYSYYGPAAAFFLLLATQLGTFLPQLTKTTGGKTMDATVGNIINYLVVLVFLYASIIMAKKFGGGAGAAIVGNANRFMKWGGGMTKGGGMWGSGARLVGKTPIVSDMYKGAKEGVSQQPFWRMLTKKGREASSKERQEKWEGKVAPFSMATARKKAKEEEFKDQARVDAGIAKGNAHDLLIGSKRGTLTEEQLENSKVKQLIASNPELRKEVLGNLRDKGRSDMAAYLRSLTPQPEDTAKNMTLKDFGREEINNNKKLGEMDWDKVTTFQNGSFKGLLVDRLNNIAETNAQGFLNIASGLDGSRMDYFKKDEAFKAVLTNAQKSAKGNRGEDRKESKEKNNDSQTGGYQSSGYGP